MSFKLTRFEAGALNRLLRSGVPRGRERSIGWNTTRGSAWLRPRVERSAGRMDVRPAGVEVQELGYRCGSCGKAGTLNLHRATLLLPPTIVDHVIAHELAHLVEPNHSPEFWLRVGRALPEYEQWKGWLAEHSVGVQL